MGVKLNSLIEKDEMELKDLRGKRVAIDGMQMLFQLIYNPYYRAIAKGNKKNVNKLKPDNSYRVYYHLYGFIQKVIHFLDAEILPIVIFDGRPSPYKKINYRSKPKDYEKSCKDYEKYMDQKKYQEAQKIAMGHHYMFKNCVNESIRLLNACGIPVFHSPNEAEAQCVALEQQGWVDYVVSTDYDCILYGAKKIIRKITFSTRKKIDGKWKTFTPKVDVIDVNDNLERLDLTREELIDISFLLGNDYFEGIKNIGPVKAVQSIRVHGSIPKMMERHPKVFTNLKPWYYTKIRDSFLKPQMKKFTSSFYLQPFTPIMIRKLLLSEHLLSEKKVDNKAQKRQEFVSTEIFVQKEEEFNVSSKGSHEINPHLKRRIERANERANKKPAEYYPSGFTQATYVEDKKPEIKKKKKKGKSEPTKWSQFVLKL